MHTYHMHMCMSCTKNYFIYDIYIYDIKNSLIYKYKKFSYLKFKKILFTHRYI